MIPYGRQEITQEDINSVVEVLKSDFLTQGPMVPKFENALSKYTTSKYSVVVNSCTSALHLACLALELNEGDYLWTSPISFVASANCALYCGAKVDFVDIDLETGLMSVEKLKIKLQKSKKSGKLPKIVIPVHLAGQSCNMAEIYELSKQYGFSIIEDAAHAIGGFYNDMPIGGCQYSDITVFSFHPVKIITSGEGGAALTNDSILADRMKLFRTHGISRELNAMKNPRKDSWYYEQIELGYNYRLTDIQASLGLSQLNTIDISVRKRSKIAHWYKENLNLHTIEPLEQNNNVLSSWHLYIVKVKTGKLSRDQLAKSLINNGINVNLHYIPIYRHPYHHNGEALENSEQYFNSALSLPIYPSIAQESLEFIVEKINLFTD